MNGTIDRLVRENLISNDIANSLMNDSAIAIGITRNLIDVSSMLYLQRDISMMQTRSPNRILNRTPEIKAAAEGGINVIMLRLCLTGNNFS